MILSFLRPCLNVILSEEPVCFCLPCFQCHRLSWVLMNIVTKKCHLYVYIRCHHSLPPLLSCHLSSLQVYFFLIFRNAADSQSAAATSHLLLARLLADAHTHTHTPDGVLSTLCFSERTKRYHLAKTEYYRGTTTLLRPCLDTEASFLMPFHNDFCFEKWMDVFFPFKIPECKLVFNLITALTLTSMLIDN